MITYPNGVQITLHRKGAVTGQDAYGKDQHAPDTDYTIVGCAFWPAGSVELVQGRETVTDSDTVSIPPANIPAGAGSVLAEDEITVNGDRYKVNGTPQALESPFTGTKWPTTVRLEKVTG